MLIDAFFHLLDVSVLLAALAGITMGIIIGAIPGLGPTIGIALLIPVTFTMEPIPSIVMLLGVYQGGIFGGSISAILLNVPGTPSSAATAQDGYPMAKQGKGGAALKLSLYASVIGNIFSCLILIVLAEPLASIALDFGPVEMSALLLFAISIIVLFGDSRRLDAMIMVLIGILAGVVGMDPISGSERFIFGSFDAENGLQLVPVLVGLFAMSEVFDQIFLYRPKNSGASKLLEVGESKVGFAWLKKMWQTLLSSSVIGTFIGILPGIGSTVPAFISYGLARSRSKNPDSFGKGNPEGVVAPETANNAVTGGALIPTLALGIPGDAVTAILLGAFTLHGLSPGPFLFQNHGVEVYAIFEALILSAIPTIILSLLLFKVAIHVIRIKPRKLFPVIAVLAVIGAFSINNSIFDVWVMLGAGLLGFIFRRGGFPLAPLLIGLILGPEFEETLRQALLLSSGSVSVFFESHLSVGFIAVTLLCILLAIGQDFYKNKRLTKNTV